VSASDTNAGTIDLAAYPEIMSTFGTPDIEITPQDARAKIDGGEAQLVDVRETYEWDEGRIAGARHIELERLASQAETIDKTRPVIFQCRLGARSAMAAQAFRTAGYEAYTMTGGLQRWADEGLPLEPEGGRVADH
jgi:hydroxyacylglutathione hydrolase/adenylyltransferase/sulfurtransferase